LRNFMYQSITKHPADYYALVLSGHGSGAVGDFLTDPDSAAPGPFRTLSIPNLRWVFDQVKSRLDKEGLGLREGKIDGLGMDSCLMSMAEVAYELRNNVRFMLGSEGFEPNTGWPYHRLLESFRDNAATMTPGNLGPLIVQIYTRYYVDYELGGVS